MLPASCGILLPYQRRIFNQNRPFGPPSLCFFAFSIASSTVETHSSKCPHMSLSQNLSTVHPIEASFRLFAASLSTFFRIFSSQYSLWVPMGLLASNPRPCQKDPSQNTAIFHFVTAMSGLPGSFLKFFLYPDHTVKPLDLFQFSDAAPGHTALFKRQILCFFFCHG